MEMLEQACKSLYGALGYEFTEKGMDSSMKSIVFASPSYKKFELGLKDGQTAYVCIGHTATDSSKLPNLTYVPNIEAVERTSGKNAVIFGQTFGHHHDNENEGMQEFYEFHGHGAMIIDKDNTGTVDVIVAKKGDKIAVPTHCNMTILNLGSNPLMTLDYANPSNNRANKKLQERIGPLFCAYIDGNAVVFELNKKYINQENEYGAGVKINSQSPETKIEFKLKDAENTGQQIYNFLLDDDLREEFSALGIHLVPAETFVTLRGTQYRKSLLEILATEGKPLQGELRFR